jgi:hypothetical protein
VISACRMRSIEPEGRRSRFRFGGTCAPRQV